jgi:hypothetical protein
MNKFAKFGIEAEGINRGLKSLFLYKDLSTVDIVNYCKANLIEQVYYDCDKLSVKTILSLLTELNKRTIITVVVNPKRLVLYNSLKRFSTWKNFHFVLNMGRFPVGELREDDEIKFEINNLETFTVPKLAIARYNSVLELFKEDKFISLKGGK